MKQKMLGLLISLAASAPLSLLFATGASAQGGLSNPGSGDLCATCTAGAYDIYGGSGSGGETWTIAVFGTAPGECNLDLDLECDALVKCSFDTIVSSSTGSAFVDLAEVGYRQGEPSAGSPAWSGETYDTTDGGASVTVKAACGFKTFVKVRPSGHSAFAGATLKCKDCDVEVE